MAQVYLTILRLKTTQAVKEAPGGAVVWNGPPSQRHRRPDRRQQSLVAVRCQALALQHSPLNLVEQLSVLLRAVVLH